MTYQGKTEQPLIERGGNYIVGVIRGKPDGRNMEVEEPSCLSYMVRLFGYVIRGLIRVVTRESFSSYNQASTLFQAWINVNILIIIFVDWASHIRYIPR